VKGRLREQARLNETGVAENRRENTQRQEVKPDMTHEERTYIIKQEAD